MTVYLLDGKSYKWGSTRFDLGAVTFSYWSKWLPKIAGEGSKIVLFADNTSIVVTNSNHVGLRIALIKTLSGIII